MAKNVFDIDNPDDYSCKVAFYVLSHQQLYLSVGKINSINGTIEWFYIAFSGVVYFEGPTTWSSANFTISSRDDKQQLVNQIEGLREVVEESDDIVLNLYSLYTIASTKDYEPDVKVKILAQSANLISEEDLEKLFKQLFCE